MSKKKILIMTDSPRIRTGFANIGRHIADRLHGSGRWDVHYLGWFDANVNSDIPIPYKLYSTARDKDGKLIKEDQYAYHSLRKYVDTIKPDILLGAGLDSVAGDRYTLIMHSNNRIELISMEEIFSRYGDEIIHENDREIIDMHRYNIRTVTVVDDVVTWGQLKYISRHRFTGNLARVRQSKGETICTYNHSLIDSDGNKTTPEEMLSKYMYQVTNIPSTLKLDKIDLVEELGRENIYYDDEYIWIDSRKSNRSRCKRYIAGDDLMALCRLLGAYVSEGSCDIYNRTDAHTPNIRCRISNTKLEWLDQLKEDYLRIFSCKGVSTETTNGFGIVNYNIVFWGKLSYHILTTLCGKGCKSKCIPNFIYNLSYECIMEFVRLYNEGDGWSSTKWDVDKHGYNFTTTSRHLTNGLCVLGSILGYSNSTWYRPSKECWQIKWFKCLSDTNRNTQIKTTLSDDEYDGYVYDLTVAEGHTFIDTHGCILLSNTWMSAAVNWVYPEKESRPYSWHSYIAIDSSPVPYETAHFGGPPEVTRPDGKFVMNWPDTFRKFDNVIAYGKWGMDQINARCGEDVCKRYIHHGADTTVYHPLGKDEVLKYRRDVLGVPDDAFLVVTVARNQPRKCYPDMLRAIKHFVDNYERGRKIIYFGLCPLEDVGWNLETYTRDIGLTSRDIKEHYRDSDGNPHIGPYRVLFDHTIKVGEGYNEDQLNMAYNAADVGLFIYTSEGWALPPHECMAAGTPTIMTEYSAPTDWASGRTLFVKPTYYEVEPITNLNKAITHYEDISRALSTLYKDKDDINYRLRKAGLEFAKENDWPVILDQWEEYLDSITLKRKPREIIRLADADSLGSKTQDEASDAHSNTSIVHNEGDDVVSPKVSIIITTQNGGQMLDNLMNSIKMNGYSNYEITIVDNASWDPTSKSKLVEYRNSGATIVEWRKKYVHGKALNMGTQNSSGELLLFLDNDTLLQPGSIQSLVDCFKSQNIGIAGARMVHPKDNKIGVTGYNHDNRLGLVPSTDGQGVHQKHAISATCMMIPRALFNIVGGFDESYNLYWEDVDLCYKIRSIGKAIVCNANANIMHLGGVTRRYMSKGVHTNDYTRLLRKWYPEYIPSRNDDRHRVAVIKLVSLGDCVTCTPLLSKIRERYPDSYITLYTTKMYSDIFQGNPHIDEIKEVGPVDKSLFGPNWSLMLYDAVTYNILVGEQWDECIELCQLDHWGEYRREPNSLSQSYANMIDIKLDDDLYDIYLSDDNHKVAEEYDRKFPGDGPLVIMHTTAGWKLKEYDKGSFAEIAKRLYDTYGARIYVLGAPGEALDSQYVRNIGGELSLRDQIALMSRAKLFIGPDSGLLHMAKAANAPILGLFGNTSIDVVGFRGVKKYIALETPYAGEVSCGFTSCIFAEAAKKEGRECLPCMQRLSVDDVWYSVQRLMDNEEVHEYRKGTNLCTTSFENSEWHTRLSEGNNPSDMCDYNP